MIRSAYKSPPTVADEGKWANPVTVWRNGFCGRPILITKVSKTRVYYRDTDRVWRDNTFTGCDFQLSEGAESYMKSDSIRYICDTLEEATKLANLSKEQEDEITATEKQIREKYGKYVENLLT